MKVSRRDFFKGTLGLVGILSGLTSSSVNLPTFPPNGNPYFYGLKAYEYSARNLKFKGEQYAIGKLIRKGYPKSDAINIISDVSRLIRQH